MRSETLRYEGKSTRDALEVKREPSLRLVRS